MKRHSHEQKTVKDPVCGMKVSYKTAVEEFEYQGSIYYFCASVCKEKFMAEPGKYIRASRPDMD